MTVEMIALPLCSRLEASIPIEADECSSSIVSSKTRFTKRLGKDGRCSRYGVGWLRSLSRQDITTFLEDAAIGTM